MDNENELLEKTIKKVSKKLLQKVKSVESIFIDFFGEENIDLQGCPTLEEAEKTLRNKVERTKQLTPQHTTEEIINKLNECNSNLLDLDPNIYVYFPEVRITNESDKYVDIKDLYVKIHLSQTGSLVGSFGLNRTTYTDVQFKNDYMHSHTPRIDRSHLQHFLSPCLGSGPIKSTVASLNKEYDESIWRLFCVELQKYIETESLSGGPYRRLEDLSNKTMSEVLGWFYVFRYKYTEFYILKDFIKYFLSKKLLKFGYIEGCFTLGMTFMEFHILISNCLIEWIKERDNSREFWESFIHKKIIEIYHIKNGKLYTINDSGPVNLDEYIGNHILTFKGESKYLNIEYIKEEKDKNAAYLLNIYYAKVLLNNILNIVNYRYGRTQNTDNSSTGETIRFL